MRERERIFSVAAPTSSLNAFKAFFCIRSRSLAGCVVIANGRRLSYNNVFDQLTINCVYVHYILWPSRIIPPCASTLSRHIYTYTSMYINIAVCCAVHKNICCIDACFGSVRMHKVFPTRSSRECARTAYKCLPYKVYIKYMFCRKIRKVSSVRENKMQ